MLRKPLRRQLDAEEKKLGESLDYLRHVADVAPTGARIPCAKSCVGVTAIAV